MPDLTDILSEISEAVRAVRNAPSIAFGLANPPSSSGVYLISVENEVTYIGKAKGSGGLRDRLLNKHLSGDDNHAIQRAYLADFPDRQLRREHIRSTVFVRWVEIIDHHVAAAVERVLICLYHPIWNKD